MTGLEFGRGKKWAERWGYMRFSEKTEGRWKNLKEKMWLCVEGFNRFSTLQIYFSCRKIDKDVAEIEQTFFKGNYGHTDFKGKLVFY